MACDASGARTFAYGATRRWVEGLRVVLAGGEVLALERGQIMSGADDHFVLVRPSGEETVVPVPRYRRPRSRKHAAGYPTGPELDLVDLFVGSEGTLGVVTEATLRLRPLPEMCLGLLIFFPSEAAGRRLVEVARSQARAGGPLEPRCLEWFDEAALGLMRRHSPSVSVPAEARAAVFAEQECSGESEDDVVERWLAAIEKTGGLADAVLAATSDDEREGLRAARHAVPVAINEEVTRRGMPKLGTDLAVPDEALDALMSLYERAAREPRSLLGPAARRALFGQLGFAPPESGAVGDPAWEEAGLPQRLEAVTFGHIGDNHLHVNFLPHSETELAFARAVYDELTREAIALGGTPSAEHGIGKIKHRALEELVGSAGVARMRATKSALDPAHILGRGNLFPFIAE